MNENQKNKPVETKEEYINSMHKIGRLFTIGAIIIMLGMPVVVSVYYNIFPGFANIIKAAAGLLMVFIPIALSEVISYTPILGSSIYLTLITGNVLNLKLPVATNALKILDIEYGTENADVVSAIAVSISSIVTIVIIALGVLLMKPLQPVLSLPSVSIARNYILPALFGSMGLGIFSSNIGGGAKASNRMIAIIIPVIVMAILCVVAPTVVSTFQGFLIIILLIPTYLVTKWGYKKGIIKVTLPSDKPKETPEATQTEE